MEVNYILIIGSTAYECHNLTDMSAYFTFGITDDRRVICNGYTDTMSYSEEWTHSERIVDFMKYRITKVVPNIKIYKVQR